MSIADPETGTIYGAGGNEWFGPAVWRSTDLGATWTHSSEGLAYPAGEQPIKAVWSLALHRWRPLRGRTAGRALSQRRRRRRPGLHLEGLQKHPSRPHWQAGGAGLILHSIVVDPRTAERIWVGISAAGVFHSGDGGLTWEPRNRGTRADFMPEDQRYPEFGQCVHNLVMAPGMSDRLYQQNHCGMYRSDDGGKSLDQHREGPALDLRLPGRRPSARSGHAVPRAAQRRLARPLHAGRQGGRLAHPRRRRRRGRTCARACRSRTPSSACCARPWRPTAKTRPASISAPVRDRSSPAPTRATPGAPSPSICRPFCRSRRSFVDA